MQRFLISFDQGGPRMPSSMRPRLPVVGVDATVSDGAVAGGLRSDQVIAWHAASKVEVPWRRPRVCGACSRSTARPGSTTVRA